MYLYYVFVYESAAHQTPLHCRYGESWWLGCKDVNESVYVSHARARTRAQAHLHGGDKRKHGPVSQKRGSKAFSLNKHKIGHK